MDLKEDRQLAKLLLDKGISWSELSESKKNLARRVYALCTQKLETLNDLTTQFKKNKFTKSSLADELGVNRRTLATNNPEVSVLVDLFIEKGRRYWGVSSSSGKKEKGVLEERIQLFLERDVEVVKKNHELEDLQKEQEARKKQYDALKEQNDAWKKKYEDLVKEYKRSLSGYSDDGKIKS